MRMSSFTEAERAVLHAALSRYLSGLRLPNKIKQAKTAHRLISELEIKTVRISVEVPRSKGIV